MLCTENDRWETESSVTLFYFDHVTLRWNTAKLPDLRTVIERSRRRPNPARNEDVEKEHGDYEKEHGNGEKEHGDGEMEFEDGGKEHEDNRKGLKGEERPVVARGRMAGARGGMRGFSPGKHCARRLPVVFPRTLPWKSPHFVCRIISIICLIVTCNVT